MALDAPTLTRPVYWTRFDTADVQAKWSDPADVHRAVMRLFARTLDGPSRERRATAGILYRIDQGLMDQGPVETVLVQSLVPPEMMPSSASSMTVGPAQWNATDGETVAFRVAVNPVRRSRAGKRGVTRRDARTVTSAVEIDKVPEWLLARVGHALTDVVIADHQRTVYKVKGSRQHALVTDVIDGFATVADQSAFDELRRSGIGRSKAYGCGLLTALRLPTE